MSSAEVRAPCDCILVPPHGSGERFMRCDCGRSWIVTAQPVTTVRYRVTTPPDAIRQRLTNHQQQE